MKQGVQRTIALLMALLSLCALFVFPASAGETYNPTYSAEEPTLEEILPQGAIAPIADDTYNPVYTPGDTSTWETNLFLPPKPSVPDGYGTTIIVSSNTANNTDFVLFVSRGTPTISDSSSLLYSHGDMPLVYEAKLGSAEWALSSVSQSFMTMPLSGLRIVYSNRDIVSVSDPSNVIFSSDSSGYFPSFIVPPFTSASSYPYYAFFKSTVSDASYRLYFFSDIPSYVYKSSSSSGDPYSFYGPFSYLYVYADGSGAWSSPVQRHVDSGKGIGLNKYPLYFNFDFLDSNGNLLLRKNPFPSPLGMGVEYTLPDGTGPNQGGGVTEPTNPTNPTDPTDPTEPTTSAADVVGDKIDGLGGKIGQFFDKLWERISGAFDGIKSAFLSLGDKLTDVKNNIVEWFQKLGEKIGELKDSFVQKMQELGTSIGNFFTALGEKIGGFFTNLWDKIWNGDGEDTSLDTKTKFDDVITSMNEWLDKLKGFTGTVDTAADSVTGYLASGTSVFDKLFSVFPAPLLALFGFAIVFIVGRKVIGR